MKFRDLLKIRDESMFIYYYIDNVVGKILYADEDINSISGDILNLEVIEIGCYDEQTLCFGLSSNIGDNNE